MGSTGGHDDGSGVSKFDSTSSGEARGAKGARGTKGLSSSSPRLEGSGPALQGRRGQGLGDTGDHRGPTEEGLSGSSRQGYHRQGSWQSEGQPGHAVRRRGHAGADGGAHAQASHRGRPWSMGDAEGQPGASRSSRRSTQSASKLSPAGTPFSDFPPRRSSRDPGHSTGLGLVKGFRSIDGAGGAKGDRLSPACVPPVVTVGISGQLAPQALSCAPGFLLRHNPQSLQSLGSSGSESRSSKSGKGSTKSRAGQKKAAEGQKRGDRAVCPHPSAIPRKLSWMSSSSQGSGEVKRSSSMSVSCIRPTFWTVQEHEGEERERVGEEVDVAAMHRRIRETEEREKERSMEELDAERDSEQDILRRQLDAVQNERQQLEAQLRRALEEASEKERRFEGDLGEQRALVDSLTAHVALLMRENREGRRENKLQEQQQGRRGQEEQTVTRGTVSSSLFGTNSSASPGMEVNSDFDPAPEGLLQAESSWSFGRGLQRPVVPPAPPRLTPPEPEPGESEEEDGEFEAVEEGEEEEEEELGGVDEEEEEEEEVEEALPEQEEWEDEAEDGDMGGVGPRDGAMSFSNEDIQKKLEDVLQRRAAFDVQVREVMDQALGRGEILEEELKEQRLLVDSLTAHVALLMRENREVRRERQEVQEESVRNKEVLERLVAENSAIEALLRRAKNAAAKNGVLEETWQRQKKAPLSTQELRLAKEQLLLKAQHLISHNGF